MFRNLMKALAGHTEAPPDYRFAQPLPPKPPDYSPVSKENAEAFITAAKVDDDMKDYFYEKTKALYSGYCEYLEEHRNFALKQSLEIQDGARVAATRLKDEVEALNGSDLNALVEE